MSIIYSIIVFLMVILVHEFGHFIVAKINNIKVNEFSIGMGPKIVSKQTDETLYVLRALPIGGYVALEGEEEESDDPRSFNNVHPLKRISVLIAGAIMNFILAIVLFYLVFSISGLPSNSTVIGNIVEDSPAYNSDLQIGDKLISFNGKEIYKWTDITPTLTELDSEVVQVVYERDGEEFETQITPKKENNSYLIGITQSIEKSVSGAFINALTYTKTVVLGVYAFIGQLITGSANVGGLSGPLGIVKMIGDQSQSGLMSLLMVAAMISANLGAFNLIPFPALDGGTILITFIEMIIGKDLPEKIKIGLNIAGLALLLGLILYVTVFNDILGANKVGLL